MSKNGFSMLETLLSLIIVLSITIVSISKYKEMNLEQYYFMNDYLLLQSESLKDYCDNDYQQGISFNQMGHVNRAKTIDINNHSIVIHLGNGYFVYE